jgi:TonB family protein
MTSERASYWLDGVAIHLIRRAARGAPNDLSERLQEEWLADLAGRHGTLARLRFAVGCCWATRVIAYDHGSAVLPATATAARGSRTGFFDYGADGSPLLSRRTATFFLVVCLHAAVLLGLAVGIKTTFTKVDEVAVENHVVPRPSHEPIDNLPPVDPSLTKTIVDIPPPEFIPADDSDGGDRDKVFTERPHTPGTVGSEPHVVTRVTGGPAAGFPSTDDFYPTFSIFHGENGSATIKVCVDPKGRLTSDPALVQSTGSARLDEGALKLAKAGSGHYRPTTEDGQPVNSCYPFRVRFQLKSQ